MQPLKGITVVTLEDAGIANGQVKVPGLGQHTDAILRELGYTAQQIAQLRSEGAV